MLRMLLLVFLPALVIGGPLACTEVQTTYSQTVYDSNSLLQKKIGKFAEVVSNSNYTYSAKYNLFGDASAYYINLYEVQGFDVTYNSKITLLCYWLTNCHIDFTTPTTIALKPTDPFVRFDLTFKNDSFFIDGFFAQNGTITHWNGRVFSPENQCVYDTYTDDSLKRNRTTCCTRFAPGIEASVTYPRCKRFRSRTIVHNADFSIFGTSSVNYTLSGNKVYMSGDWDGQTTGGFEFANKFFLGSDPSKKFTMNVTLPAGESRNYFTNIFQAGDLPIAVQDVIAFTIDAKNNTLMYGATPYTTSNDCTYHSFNSIRGGVPLPTTVEMCCKEFES